MTANQAGKGFAEVIEAVREGPVLIQQQAANVAVVMSVQEYERLIHTNLSEFQHFSDQVGAKAGKAGMTEDVLQELLSRED
ncbi:MULTISPECIES: type II toxin-antitoxin system prevent-host-death family antitoxin [Delftia]|nr:MULTISPECIES: type II toxin-antitoxin system prevent-host-death family antitoxin [Delftia]